MSSYAVEVLYDRPEIQGLEGAVLAAANETLAHQEAPPNAGLTVLFTGSERLRELNRAYLGYDEPTDVLSFPAGVEVPGAEGYLGDIAISLTAAREQAQAAGHPLEAEVQLLTVHAVLHLLGFDHADEEGKEHMWAAQKEILARLGNDVAPPGAIA